MVIIIMIIGQSGNIIDTLEGLGQDATTQLDKARSEEEKALQNFKPTYRQTKPTKYTHIIDNK